MNQQKDKMHPEDMRNLILFFVISILVYFAYDHFILKPQSEALNKQRAAIAKLQEAPGPNGESAASQKPVNRAEIIESASFSERISIRNGELAGTLSLKGARIDDLSLLNYQTALNGDENVHILSPKGSLYPRYIDYGWVSADKEAKLPDADTRWRASGNAELSPGNPVTLSWNNGQGLRFERVYTVDENFLIAVTQKVENTSGKDITLYPYGLVTQTGLPQGLEGRFISHEGPIAYVGENLEEMSYKDLQKKGAQTLEGPQGWIAFSDKYWITSLIPQQGVQAKYRFSFKPDAAGFVNRGRYQVDYTGSPVLISAGKTGVVKTHIVAGAKKVLLLEEYEDQLGAPHMDLAVDFGMFYFMTKPFFYILHFFGEHTGNMGIAIILLTILIRSAVFPLTNTSYKSFAKMKQVSPQIMELRERHKDDKQKLQQGIMELYQKEGVNPLAGCFPILLQIPIFFALYKILFVTIEIRHAPFFGWIEDLSARDPTSIFNLFGLLPYDVPGFLMIGVWPCVMLVAMIIQKKLNPPPTDPIQRDLMNYFPFIITYVLSQFASGLVIYWTFSAIISIIQQIIIMKRMGVPVHLFGETEDEKKVAEAPSKGKEEKSEAAPADEDDTDDAPKVITPPKKKKSKKKKK